MTVPDSATRPLLQRWPDLAPVLPHVLLGDLPTPVEASPALAAGLDIGGLTIKRDDLSAADYGGNKVRKLEFLLGDALAQRRRHIITFGGLGSNHAIATSLNCRKFGLPCTAILTPEPVTDLVRTTLARHVELGTEVVLAEHYPGVRAAADAVIARHGAEQCYEVPFGGSSVMGAIGFVNAALELAAQLDGSAAPDVIPDVIYVACGTAGTIAGLALGLELAGLPTRVEAVQVTPDSLQPARHARELIDGMAALLARGGVPGLDTAAACARLRIRNDQLGEGYAMPTAAGRAAAERWRAATGLPVSLTYTAKALAALFADAAAGRLAGQQVMYWNTYNSQRYTAPADTDWSALPAALRALIDR